MFRNEYMLNRISNREVIKYILVILAGLLSVSSGHANMNGDSKQSKVIMAVGIAANVTAAVVYTTECIDGDAMACAGAATTAAQALANVGTRSGASSAYNATGCLTADCLGLSFPDINIPNPNVNTGYEGANPFGDLPGPAQDILRDDIRQAEIIRDQLQEQGYSIDRNGKVKTPSGRTIDPKSLSSASSAAEAGIGASEYSDFLALSEKAQAAAKKRADQLKNLLDTDINGDGGGGGGGKGAAVASNGNRNNDFWKKFLLDKKAKAKDAGIEGLSKEFNGEPIGVAGDNIFEMITRRYDAKETQGTFVEGPAGSRVPASASRWYIKNK